MIHKVITKRCERCGSLDTIPKSSSSFVFEKILLYHKCSFCKHTNGSTDENDGRCKVCSIPFKIIKHHAKGMCLRDYNATMRETLQNNDIQ